MQWSILLLLVAMLSNCGKKSSSTAPVVITPKISIDDISRLEGNTGTTLFTFTVSLDQAATTNVSVNYTTVEGFAKATQDFTPSSGIISFAPNETQKTISISVVADDIKEADEDFYVVLSSPVNATLYKSSGTGIIQNDDTRVPFANTGYDAPTSYPGYTLAWADEFNGTTLNSSDWSFENGDGCPGNCGWGNNEQEYYTDRPDNLFFQSGKLIIEAKK